MNICHIRQRIAATQALRFQYIIAVSERNIDNRDAFHRAGYAQAPAIQPHRYSRQVGIHRYRLRTIQLVVGNGDACPLAPVVEDNFLRICEEAVRNAEPVGAFVNDQSAVLIQTYCAESHEQAVRDVSKPLDVVAQLAAELFLPWAEKGRERKAETYKYLAEQQQAAIRAGANVSDVEQRTRDGVIAVGTPDELVKLFRKYRDMGVDQMLTWVQFGGLEHSKIMQSMELIGKYVLPELNR